MVEASDSADVRSRDPLAGSRPTNGRARTAAMVIVGVVALALTVWSIAAQVRTDRVDNDAVDVLAGRPDPDRSAIEAQLAWILDAMEGRPITEAEVEARFDFTFLAAIPGSEVVATADAVAASGPFEFLGFSADVDEGVAGALLVDSRGSFFGVEMTVVAGDDSAAIDGLYVGPFEPDRGVIDSLDFMVHLGAGLWMIVVGALLVVFDRAVLAGLAAAAGLLGLAQLLELADAAPAYTVGLAAGPVAVAATALLVVAAPDGTIGDRWTRMAAAGSAVAVLASVLALTAVDTAAVGLPDQLLHFGGDRAVAEAWVRTAGWLTAAAAATVACVLLFRQFRADWATDRGLVVLTVGGTAAAALVAVPAAWAGIDLGHHDLTQTPMASVAMIVAGSAVVGTVAWQRYDAGPEAAVLQAENTELHAELATQLAQVRASRARIVHAADEARRRVERDLHDGAQQRLVAMKLALQLGRQRFGVDDSDLDGYLACLADELGVALDELRALSRGLHPAILDRGIVAAAQSLAETSPLPVSVRSDGEPRCDADIELAAWFVVSEALTNAARHSGAGLVEITIAHGDGRLSIQVVDDGVGGAAARAGSGLSNLEDRVLAVGGSWQLVSRPGAGTTMEVQFPCG